MNVKRVVAPPDEKRNLILVADNRFDRRDLREISLEIVGQALDIAVHLVAASALINPRRRAALS